MVHGSGNGDHLGTTTVCIGENRDRYIFPSRLYSEYLQRDNNKVLLIQ
jgi:hypothetical protein